MRTDDLIRTLVADHTPARLWSAWSLAGLVAIGFAASSALFSYELGLRPDFAAAMCDPRFLFKFIVTLGLAASALTFAVRLARPGTDPRPAFRLLLIAPVLMVAALVVELSVVPASEWRTVLVGDNWLVCLISVPILALPLLAAALIGLRMAAPTAPMIAGAAAGLLAGGLAATLYASHCMDDSPLFVAAWYSLAIAIVTAAGALIGARVLRW